MSEMTVDEDPCPCPEPTGIETEYFWNTCRSLDRQCDHLDEDGIAGLWRGVDIPMVAIDDMPLLLGTNEQPYDGQFMEFCRKAVHTKGYRRLGVEDELFNLRLKIVPGTFSDPSITILLQREYAGYDVSIENGHVVLSQLGARPKVIEGERAVEVIEDISYVANRLLHLAYHSSPVSSKIQVCDSLVPSATSEALASRPKRNFGMRALKLFRI
jgi:hypothetical protein